MSQTDEQKARENRHEDRQLTASSQSVAMQSAMRKQQEKIQNPNFLEALRDSDLDIEVGDGKTLEDLYPTWHSGARAVTNRGDSWDQEADLLMKNKRERRVTQRKPGRLLRDRPFVLATMQGADTPQVDAYESPEIPGNRAHWKQKIATKNEVDKPFTSTQVSKVYGAAEIAADQMALSRNAAGLEATSTATTETRVTRDETEESAKKRLGSVLE
jgi:hypothetical protein